MTQVKVEFAQEGFPRVTIGGVELPEVVDATVVMRAGELPTLHASINLIPPITLEADMAAHLHLILPEGTKLIDITTHETAGKRLQVVKVE
jgi:hypothetical protein